MGPFLVLLFLPLDRSGLRGWGCVHGRAVGPGFSGASVDVGDPVVGDQMHFL